MSVATREEGLMSVNENLTGTQMSPSSVWSCPHSCCTVLFESLSCGRHYFLSYFLIPFLSAWFSSIVPFCLSLLLPILLRYKKHFQINCYLRGEGMAVTGGPKTTLWGLLSPSTLMSFPGTELRLADRAPSIRTLSNFYSVSSVSAISSFCDPSEITPFP